MQKQRGETRCFLIRFYDMGSEKGLLHVICIDGKGVAEFPYAGGDGGDSGPPSADDFGHEVGDLSRLLPTHAARCHGGGADAKPTRDEGRSRLKGDGIFICRDVRPVEQSLELLARHILSAKV